MQTPLLASIMLLTVTSLTRTPLSSFILDSSLSYSASVCSDITPAMSWTYHSPSGGSGIINGTVPEPSGLCSPMAMEEERRTSRLS